MKRLAIKGLVLGICFTVIAAIGFIAMLKLESSLVNISWSRWIFAPFLLVLLPGFSVGSAFVSSGKGVFLALRLFPFCFIVNGCIGFVIGLLLGWLRKKGILKVKERKGGSQ